MAGLHERYDSALLGILQNEGQIAKFLDTIYGFLYRKTDYYMIMREKTAKMGFPEGIALKLSVGAFKKYEQLAARNEEQRRKQAEVLKKQTEQAKTQREKKPEKPKSENSETTQASQGDKKETTAPDSSASNPTTGTDKKTEQSCPEKIQAPTSSASSDPSKQDETARQDSTCTKDGGGEKRNKDDEDDNPELTKLQKQFQANPASHNGAARDNYSWSQSISDVDVLVHVPKWVRKGADVKVQIEKKHIKAYHREQTKGGFVTILDEPLTWDINKEESMWSLVPGEHIHINLEKIQERWWEALLESEPKISVRKIDPSRPITDLDDEAQAKIEEMMYNERQKRLGLPQSHETKVHDMLKNAWDLEGSPFKGQPFDPSLVNVQNPGDFSMPGGGPPPGK